MIKNYKKVIISPVDRILLVSFVQVSQTGSQGVTYCGITGREIFTVSTKMEHTYYRHKDYSIQINFPWA